MIIIGDRRYYSGRSARIGRMTWHAALWLIWMFVTSCAITVAPIPVEEAGTILKNGEQGLLLFMVDSQTDIPQIDFDGQQRFSLTVDQMSDSSVVMVNLPPGEYEIASLHVKLPTSIVFNRKHPIVELELGELQEQSISFRITAGQINYLGHLQFDFLYYDRGEAHFGVQVDVVNRSSFAYVYLRDHAPQLLSDFPIRYAGFGEDDFFAEIERLRAQQQAIR